MYVYDRWAPVKLLLSFAVIAFLAGFSIQGYRDMPENAPVLFNAQTAAYTARRCLNLHPEDANWIGYITVKDARTFGYHADPKCADAGGFSQDARSLSGALLEYLGILDRFLAAGKRTGRGNGDASQPQENMQRPNADAKAKDRWVCGL